MRYCAYDKMIACLCFCHTCCTFGWTVAIVTFIQLKALMTP